MLECLALFAGTKSPAEADLEQTNPARAGGGGVFHSRWDIYTNTSSLRGANLVDWTLFENEPSKKKKKREKSRWMGVGLFVRMQPTDSLKALGNSPFNLSQHLAWWTHTIAKGYTWDAWLKFCMSAKILISTKCRHIHTHTHTNELQMWRVYIKSYNIMDTKKSKELLTVYRKDRETFSKHLKYLPVIKTYKPCAG